MKKKVHILLLIFLNVWGGINAQNIEFSNDILKKHLISSSTENEVAKDINGNPMAIDANGDGEISLQEALNVYQLQVGMNNIYPTSIPANSTSEKDFSSELTYFTNVRVFKYEGLNPRNCTGCLYRFINATGFTNLEELYFINGHYFYKVYPITIQLPEYLPNLKIVDAPIKISYSQAPNLEDLNCSYTFQLGSGSSGLIDTYDKLNFYDFKKLKKIIANADTIIIKNLPILDSVSLDSKFTHLEKLPKLKNFQLRDTDSQVDNKSLTIKNLPILERLDCSHTQYDWNVSSRGLKTLTLEDLPQLEYIDCSKNELSSLDLSKNIPNLKYLIIKDNKFNTPVNLTKNIYLKELNIDNSTFYVYDSSILDLSNNHLLTHLYLRFINIDSLNLTQNPDLINLQISDLFLNTLDLSGSTKISSISGYYNTIKNFIIKNGVSDLWLDSITSTNYSQFISICCDDIELEKVKNIFSSYSTKKITTDCSSLSLATNEIKTQTEVTLYPNPATDFLYINTKEKITKIEIFDTNGRLLVSENITSPKVTVSTLPKGSYFMTLHYAKGKINKPFIKN
ncbi:T9SS type A sorting domain-containing protein [Apibacter raozihei]|uniref:T9SS type A sorting domain-containing protein n=1 Tax=Apibacter raozihei TaxID=2500547 RepID=UPI000FE2C48B|nr:T9SS type A sorting domain-containing protein [Apibacter raozihei]